jgi:transmembrane protein 33
MLTRGNHDAIFLVSLIPFATFSLFHALTFLRSNILPQFFPPTPPAAAGQPAIQHPVLKKLQAFIKGDYCVTLVVCT